MFPSSYVSSRKKGIKMKIKSLLFFWIICAQLIYSQSLADLYKNELPDVVFQNDEFKSTVETNLQYYTSFSPVLAGYYIEHFKKKFVEKISDNDSNYYNQLQTLRDSLLILRNDWAEEQLNELNSRSLNQLHENLVSNILDDFLADDNFQTKTPKVFFKNDQRLKYIYYKHLANDPEIEFSQTKNYDKLIEAESKRIVKSLDSLYSQNLIIDLDEVNQYALNNKFLFSDSYQHIQLKKIEHSLIDFLIKVLKPKIQQEEGFYFKIGSGIGKFNSIEGDDFYVVEENLIGQKIVDAKFHNVKTDIVPSINFGVGYKFRLRESKSLFSYLNIEADYILSRASTNNNTEEDYVIPFFVVDPNSIYARHLIATYSISKKQNQKFFVLRSYVLTPVYYPFTWLHIATGVTYSYVSLTYEHNVAKRDELGINGLERDINNFDLVKKSDFAKQKFGVVFSAEAEISYGIFIDLRYQTEDYVSFDMKYQF